MNDAEKQKSAISNLRIQKGVLESKIEFLLREFCQDNDIRTSEIAGISIIEIEGFGCHGMIDVQVKINL